MFVPYAGEDAPERPPVVTLALVSLSFAVFAAVAAVTLTVGPAQPIRWFAELALVPDALRWHTTLTYWVLHEHLFHLSVNMLLLFVVGGCVENGIGARAFALMFVAAAVVTGLVESWAVSFGPSAGADVMVIGSSGAVAGLLGAFAALFYAGRVRIAGTRLRARVMPLVILMALGEVASIGWHALSSATPTAPSAANWAHVAGFLFGIAWIQTRRLIVPGARSRTAIRPSALGPSDASSRFASAAHWEALLDDDPHAPEALVGLPMALWEAGDPERAATCAATAIAEALDRRSYREAADRFTALRELAPDDHLSDDHALLLAAAMADAGDPETAVGVYEALASRTDDDATRARATLRAAACLIRRLGRPAEGADRLKALTLSASDADSRAYADRLLREAEAPEQ